MESSIAWLRTPRVTAKCAAAVEAVGTSTTTQPTDLENQIPLYFCSSQEIDRELFLSQLSRPRARSLKESESMKNFVEVDHSSISANSFKFVPTSVPR